jgi:hypothetical protein
MTMQTTPMISCSQRVAGGSGGVELPGGIGRTLPL